MRKWALRAGVFVLSYFLGCAATSLWFSHRVVTLCDIDANPQSYAGKVVRLRVFVSNDVFIRSADNVSRYLSACSVCSGDDVIPGATLDLASDQIDLVPENRHVGRRVAERIYVTEAVISGRFEPPSFGITHCFAPKYQISNAKIERVISHHEFLTAAEFLEWSKSNTR